MAPKLDVPETLNDDAPVIAASKSTFPVIPIAPRALVPPTIPANWVVPDPVLIVKFLAVEFEELIVLEKVILELVVVKVLATDKVVAPV